MTRNPATMPQTTRSGAAVIRATVCLVLCTGAPALSLAIDNTSPMPDTPVAATTSEDLRAVPPAPLVTVFTPAYLDAADAIAGLLTPAHAAADTSYRTGAPARGSLHTADPAPALPTRAATLAAGQDCAPRAEDYPPSALRARATGVTRLRIGVEPTGRPGRIDIVQSAGATRAHAALDREAVWRLSDCRFEPARDSLGRPMKADFEAEIVWTLP